MAFIPDEAIFNAANLTPSAFRLYALHCAFRDHAARLSRLSVERAQTKSGLSRSQIFAALKELLDKNWMSKTDSGFILTMGDFAPVNRRDFNQSENSDSQSENSDSNRSNSPKIRTTSPKIQTNQSENSDSQSENSDSPYKEYPESLSSDSIQNLYPEKHLSETSSDDDSQTSKITPVNSVFEFWKKTTNHPAARLTAERQSKIIARLKDGYTVDQIKTAIEGARASPFHQGLNDTGQIFDDLTLICRNGSKLESFIALKETTPSGEKLNGKQHGKPNRNGGDEQHPNDLDQSQKTTRTASERTGATPAGRL